MGRDRRMIGKSISTSRKLNHVCDLSALLFSWLIPHADDFGRMEGDAETIKARVVPMRDTFPIKIVKECLLELSKNGLILYYSEKNDPEKEYLEIINFLNYQSFHGITKTPSNIPVFDESNHVWLTGKPILIDESTQVGSKLNKTKPNQTKQNNISFSISDLFDFCKLVLRKTPYKLNKKRELGIKDKLKNHNPDEIKLAIMEMKQDKFLSGEDEKNESGKDYLTFDYIFLRKDDRIQKYLEEAINGGRWKIQRGLSEEETAKVISQKWREYVRTKYPNSEYSKRIVDCETDKINKRTDGGFSEIPGQRVDKQGNDIQPGIHRGQNEQGKAGIQDASTNIFGCSLPEGIDIKH